MHRPTHALKLRAYILCVGDVLDGKRYAIPGDDGISASNGGLVTKRTFLARHPLQRFPVLRQRRA